LTDDAHRRRLADVRIRIDRARQPLNVLLIEEYPRWEFRYVRTALLREPTVRLAPFLLSADRVAPAPEATLPLKRIPEAVDEFAAVDAILFGDVDLRAFTDKQLQALRDFVTVTGGGLILVCGARHQPRESAKSPLADLLPFDAAAAKGTDAMTQAYHATPTAAGRDWPSLVPAADPAIYDKLDLYWHVTGLKPRPDRPAAILLERTTPAGGREPLLAAARAGNGYVILSAIDETWRWRQSPAGPDFFLQYWLTHARFVGQNRVSHQKK
jgi:hypothetical protein